MSMALLQQDPWFVGVLPVVPALRTQDKAGTGDAEGEKRFSRGMEGFGVSLLPEALVLRMLLPSPSTSCPGPEFDCSGLWD